jgi:hypothetical protein
MAAPWPECVLTGSERSRWHRCCHQRFGICKIVSLSTSENLAINAPLFDETVFAEHSAVALIN